MKRFLRLLVVLLALSIPTPPVGVAADQKGKTVHVKEYTKNDGTTVAAHDRKAPEQHATATKAEKPKKASTVSQPAAGARNERGRIQPAMPPGTPSRDKPAIQTAAQGGSSITSSRSPAAGSADAPSHMQWQSVAEAKAKDKVERVGCR